MLGELYISPDTNLRVGVAAIVLLLLLWVRAFITHDDSNSLMLVWTPGFLAATVWLAGGFRDASAPPMSSNPLAVEIWNANSLHFLVWFPVIAVAYMVPLCYSMIEKPMPA